MTKYRIGSALLATAALALSLAAVGVSPAMATPKGEYAVFSECPLSNPELTGCLAAHTESGHVTLGNQEVPIALTQTLQAGLINRGLGDKEVVGATLTKTAQKVPGGLLGIKCSEITGEWWLEKEARKLCAWLFENKLTNVYATTELAGTVSLSEIALELEEGTALVLPVKVKLENELFGSECYIGSSSEPIKLELSSSPTVGGKFGKTSTRAGGGILVISENTLAGNSFSAPEATGCGLFGLLDGLINSKLGLPAKTGNSAVLNGTLEQASSELVEDSEL
jgi:hypothetical protein